MKSDYTNREFHDAVRQVIMQPGHLDHRVPFDREAMCAFPERPIDGTWKPWAALGCKACAMAIQGHIADARRKGMRYVMPTTVGTLSVGGWRGATLFIEATNLLCDAAHGVEPGERKSLLDWEGVEPTIEP